MIYLTHGERGRTCLKALLNAGYIPKAIVSIEELPKEETGEIPVIMSTRGFPLSQVQQYEPTPDIIVAAGYNRILPPDIVNLSTIATINLHGGKLPQYRGASITNWQIINGETVGGCAVIVMTEGIDTGDILDQKFYPIHDQDTIEDVRKKQLELFPQMLIQTIENLYAGTAKPVSQSKSEVCRYTKRYPEDSEVFWGRMSAQTIHNIIRASEGSYGAYTITRCRTVIKLLASRLLDETIKGIPGRIVSKDNDTMIVVAMDRALEVTYEGYVTGRQL